MFPEMGIQSSPAQDPTTSNQTRLAQNVGLDKLYIYKTLNLIVEKILQEIDAVKVVHDDIFVQIFLLNRQYS